MQRIIALILLFLTSSGLTYSQEKRLSDENFIGWLVYNGTFKFHQKFSAHTEYQFRRVDGLENGQQHLLRAGVNYIYKPSVIAHAGYGYILTFPYGDYPTVLVGTLTPEHRIYEQVVLKNPVGRCEIIHRYRLEQRWIGKITSQSKPDVESWIYLNRLRYSLRLNMPLVKKLNEKNSLYAVAADEIFIGFGKNLGSNIFDQNRIGAFLGYKFNNNLKVETGFLSQIVQQGGRVNNSPVIQYNSGFQVAAFLDAGLLKKEK